MLDTLQKPASPANLPIDRLERTDGWGMAVTAAGYVYRPSTVEGIRAAFALARDSGHSVVLRGSGRSYGDASVNPEHIVLDLTRFNRILAWNPATGILTAEAGATLGQLWRYCIGDGWWPPVVSGTMFPTLGGALGANIHGKNNFKAGPLGDHVDSFELLTAAGDILLCSRESNGEIFRAAIGGFGLLGCILTVTLRMKKVASGLLDVKPYACANLDAMLRLIDDRAPAADYLVGWVDCFGEGAGTGRGLVHEARYLAEGADPQATQTLRAESQELPETMFGVIPKSWLWLGLRLFLFDLGMRLVNFAKWKLGNLMQKPYRQSHAAFAFLLDYVPGWKRAYLPGGLVQFQSFVPHDKAAAVFQGQIAKGRAAGLTPYLAVLKKHRPDDFLLSHAVDGFSLALDFRVTRRNRERVWQLCDAMAQDVVAARGRFYLAKDATLTRESFTASLPPASLAEFKALKRRLDPEGILQSAQARRLGLV
jgi:FAD/FMN-containing dehydrogenase